MPVQDGGDLKRISAYLDRTLRPDKWPDWEGAVRYLGGSRRASRLAAGHGSLQGVAPRRYQDRV